MKYLKITCKKAKSVTIDPDTDYYALRTRSVFHNKGIKNNNPRCKKTVTDTISRKNTVTLGAHQYLGGLTIK
jgi:hypothetical protein